MARPTGRQGPPAVNTGSNEGGLPAGTVPGERRRGPAASRSTIVSGSFNRPGSGRGGKPTPDLATRSTLCNDGMETPLLPWPFITDFAAASAGRWPWHRRVALNW